MKIGDRAGDYEIVAVLGSGGMGQVWKVRNVLSERIEAMKILLPSLEGDPQLADRFLREIKVQAGLDHPNIAKLHTAFRAGDQLVMTLEFVEGESIDKLLSAGPLSPDDAIRYTRQVLDALAYAHGRGVIHRDIKPANLQRTPTGTVKLLDFGIARLQTDSRLTQAGRAVGSLAYMSPEQIRGTEPDARSDLYSLGVTLYEMVTGRRPFSGISEHSIMSAHLEQTPPAPIDVVAGVPALLSEIILVAMAKDPAARFQTAAAMNAAMSTLATAAKPPSEATTVANVVTMPPPLAGAGTPPPVPVAVTASIAPTKTLTRPSPVTPPPVPEIPVIPPVAAAAIAARPEKSNRGLYITVGSLATIAVLALAVIYGPRFIGVGASGSGASVAPAASTAPAATPVPAAAPIPISPQAAPASPAADVAPTPPPARFLQEAPPLPSRSTAAKPQAKQDAQFRPVPAQEIRPAGSPQAPPPAALPVTPQAPAAPQAPAVDRAQLNDLREKHNNLAVSASSLKSGLRSIERQMAAQGLGLRGDIKEAETRMDYQMQQAMESIRAGDIDAAKQHLDYAQNASQTIAKFLGR